MSKKNGRTVDSSVVMNVCLKAISIAATLVLMTVMILNAPILVLRETNGAVTTIENVSITKYLKRQKPVEHLEGTISRVDSDEVILHSEVDTTFDDGLDLNQVIEGQYTVLFLGFDSVTNGSGNLHDVNYLVQFNLLTASMNILQIPRDSYMPDYTTSPTLKFNSIHACGDSSVSGIQRVVNAVQDSFGIPIDAYVTTNCDNIVDIVDMIGGIPIDMPYTVVYEPGKVIYEGEQVLNGTQSEWFVRCRHGIGGDGSDIGRIQSQRVFLAAAMRKVLDMGNLQLLSALSEIYENELLATDLSLEDISRLADLGSTISMDNVNVFMVPGESAMAYGQSIWSIHKSAALEIVNTHFRTQQVPLEYENSAIVEWVPEGSYQSTLHDDTEQNLDEIYNQE